MFMALLPAKNSRDPGVLLYHGRRGGETLGVYSRVCQPQILESWEDKPAGGDLRGKKYIQGLDFRAMKCKTNGVLEVISRKGGPW